MNDRKLRRIDELSLLDGGKCALRLRGVCSFLSNKYDITKHPNCKDRSDYVRKHEFNVEKNLSTKLKVKPEEAYDENEISVEETENS